MGGQDRRKAARRVVDRPRRLSAIALAVAAVAPLAGLGVLAAAAWSPVRAQALTVEIGADRVGAVRVAQGKSQTLQTTAGFVDLVVGDPEIADVMPLTDRSLYVLGKKLGITNVSVYDAGKQIVGVIEIEVSANAPRLSADLERAAPGVGMRVTTANGRTVLSGAAPDGATAARAVTLAKQYGSEVVNDLRVTSPQQVMLEVRFVEASRNASKELGVGIEAQGANYGSRKRGALNLAAATGLGLATGNAPFGAFIGRVLSSGVEVDLVIDALEEKGLARRLAEPNLIAMSGEKASFLAGGEFPIPVQADGDKIAVEFKKFGVGLTFLPTVLSNGVINLKIEPEVSQIDNAVTVRTAGIVVPGLSVRRASTVVELRDGQSFAVAGLLSSVNEETVKALPWLGDIPILGALFRSESFERKETDLAIIVTPRLVKPAKPGQRLRTPLDNTAPANDADLFAFNRLEVPARTAGRAPAPGGYIFDLPRGAALVAKN